MRSAPRAGPAIPPPNGRERGDLRIERGQMLVKLRLRGRVAGSAGLIHWALFNTNIMARTLAALLNSSSRAASNFGWPFSALPGASRGVPPCRPYDPQEPPCSLSLTPGHAGFVNGVLPVPHRGEQPHPTGVNGPDLSYATEHPHANPDITPSTEESYKRGLAAFTLGESIAVFALAFLIAWRIHKTL